MFVTQLKDYINKNNKTEVILESLGCHNIKDHTDYVSASFPDGNNPQGINISKDEYLSFCSWSRNIPYSDGQDIINLIELIRKCDFISALKWLHDILGLEYSIMDMHKRPKDIDLKSKALSVFTKHLSGNGAINVADIEVLDEAVLDEYTPIEYIGLLREGITPQACRRFGIQYSYKRRRIIIPHRYWQDGTLIGTNARTTLDSYEELGINKYSFSKGFNKSINLYGLWENYNSINKKGHITIFEAEKSVLKRYSQFDETAVALGGKIISEEQKRILIGLNVEIIIALDNDVDINEIYSLCEKFYGLRPVSFIKDSKEILGAKDSPADVCEKDYRWLFKNRIVYNEEKHKKYLEAIGK